jgi:hypothetical protein
LGADCNPWLKPFKETAEILKESYYKLQLSGADVHAEQLRLMGQEL